MGFLRQSAQPFAGPRSRGLDYGVLVATLQAMQLATPTARAGSRPDGPIPPLWSRRASISQILFGKEDWQQAVIEQGGSFNPAFACGSRPID